MSMRASRLMDKGLIERPDDTTLIYAYSVRITDFSSEDEGLRDTCSLTQLAEHVTRYESQDSPIVSSVRFQSASLALITPSIFPVQRRQVSLLIHAHIKLCEPLPSLVPTLARRPMLVLAKAIDLFGSTGTTRHIRDITFSALSTYSGAGWLEPPPRSIANRKVTRSFSVNWETLTDGHTQSISRA